MTIMTTMLSIIPMQDGLSSGVAVTASSAATGDFTQSTATVRTLLTPVDATGTSLARAFALSFGDPVATASASTDGTLDGLVVRSDGTHSHTISVQAGPITLAQAISVTHLTGTTLILPA